MQILHFNVTLRLKISQNNSVLLLFVSQLSLSLWYKNKHTMNANKNLIENSCRTLRTKDSMYATSTKKVAGNMWDIMWVFGSSNYVSVTKMTNNPAYKFGGKIYKSFEDAARNYKSPEMKTALMMAEIELKEYIAIEEIKRLSVLN